MDALTALSPKLGPTGLTSCLPAAPVGKEKFGAMSMTRFCLVDTVGNASSNVTMEWTA